MVQDVRGIDEETCPKRRVQPVAMKKLVRLGSCNHCGMCGCGDCGHFINDRCDIWRTTQPVVCRHFPTHPRQISQHFECAIKFYDSKTGVEVSKKKHRRPDGLWECDWDELNSYPPLEEDYP